MLQVPKGHQVLQVIQGQKVEHKGLKVQKVRKGSKGVQVLW